MCAQNLAATGAAVSSRNGFTVTSLSGHLPQLIDSDRMRIAAPPRPLRFVHDGSVLLAQDEVAPLEVQSGNRDSPFLIICDHAGNLIPRSLGGLGLPAAELERHIAWDIGAGAVARRLGAALGAHTVWQRYSRLVIDCNRPLDARDSIARRSENTVVPGNQDVGPAAAEERAREIFHPYHDEIGGALDRRKAEGRSTVLVAMHSFTPVFMEVARPWHVGVLYNRDSRVAHPLLQALRDEGDLVVGDNQPYAVGDLTDYSIVNHGERRGLPHVELEIRQDLIAHEEGQQAWAERFARLLPLVIRGL
jgi:predicted N-formylglutamate amidohydrolase